MSTQPQKKLVFNTSFASISAEIHAVIERHGMQRDLSVLASIVINNHPQITGKDRDFHLCASFRAIRKEVLEQLNRPHGAGDNHTTDFIGLKEGYNVERDARQLHLPLEELSFEELMAKADEYETQSKTLLAEARALRRYAFAKFPAQASEYGKERTASLAERLL